MKLSKPHPHRRQAGASLIEMILVIVIIGVLTAVAIPIIKGLDRASASKSKRNAQLMADVSSNLNSLGVVHVLPDSLGGVHATARLLQQGIVIPDGAMEGAYMGMNNLPRKEIEPTSEYLQLVYDESGIRLEYNASAQN